jgi:translation initiation factor IF-2
MATAGKKYKVFKICKQLNLGHDTIVGFLEGKGLKGAGLNTAVSEELYFEILDRFATEKQKADKIVARKGKTTEENAVEKIDEEAEKSKTENSAYIEAVKKSIEDNIEALAKPVEKVEKKPRRKKVTKVEETKVEAAKQVEEKKTEVVVEKAPKVEKMPQKTVEKTPEAKPEVKPETKQKEEKKNISTEKTPEAKDKDPKKKEHSKNKKEFDKKKEKPVEGSAKEQDESKKKKTKDKKKHKKEEHLSEKEKKRRKALEMIRKDGKKSGKKINLAALGEDGEPGSRRRKKNKPKKKRVDLKQVEETVKKTLASMESKGRKPKKQKKVKTEDGEEIIENIIEVTEFISANDLADLMDVPVNEIITKCMELGLMVSINQRLDIDTITLLADEYDYKVEERFAEEFIEEDIEEEEDSQENLKSRAPIVTIMGHVDHGKTSLLDHLRESNIVDGEAGGITQHIGAYEVVYKGRKITFLDTPGHEAFTAMRARGAQVTDIVILIIAADDAVMPQTIEALDHAKAAGVKIVIAINKIDKPAADSERIKQQLAERDVLDEDWGGTYQSAEISAKSGKGIPELLEKVVLEAEMLDLKANPDKRARGIVIESRLDKGKGAVATVLVLEGTLAVGNNFIAGNTSGKVRTMLNEQETRLIDVSPAQPALITGFIDVPQAGDKFIVMKDEKAAREIATKRQRLKREQDAKKVKLTTLAQISEQIKSGVVRELPILVKADVDGSAEALVDSLLKINTDEVKVDVVRKAVGPITETDVLLASAAGAVIIGFHIRANAKARELAEKEGVDIRLYRVVYDAINDVKMALEGLLEPDKEETILGQAEIRETFKISKIGVIAGCYMLSGKIARNSKIRLIRDDVEIYDGSLASLKRFKEDAKEVLTGFECGMQVENYNDLKIGDIIEAYEIKSVKRSLA